MRALIVSKLFKNVPQMFSAGKPVAAVCHAPIVYQHCKDLKTGKPLLEGREVTAISNSEENAIQTGHRAVV